MGQTRKRHYDRYTLAYKLTAVKLANHPEVKSCTVAESLGLHPVMLYRWQMEYRKGELRENRHMETEDDSPKRRRADPGQTRAEELTAAKRRIRQLEKALAQHEEELELLKKSQAVLRESKKVKFAFIEEHRHHHEVRRLCRLLGVSRSGSTPGVAGPRVPTANTMRNSRR